MWKIKACLPWSSDWNATCWPRLFIFECFGELFFCALLSPGCLMLTFPGTFLFLAETAADRLREEARMLGPWGYMCVWDDSPCWLIAFSYVGQFSWNWLLRWTPRWLVPSQESVVCHDEAPCAFCVSDSWVWVAFSLEHGPIICPYPLHCNRQCCLVVQCKGDQQSPGRLPARTLVSHVQCLVPLQIDTMWEERWHRVRDYPGPCGYRTVSVMVPLGSSLNSQQRSCWVSKEERTAGLIFSVPIPCVYKCL